MPTGSHILDTGRAPERGGKDACGRGASMTKSERIRLWLPKVAELMIRSECYSALFARLDLELAAAEAEETGDLVAAARAKVQAKIIASGIAKGTR